MGLTDEKGLPMTWDAKGTNVLWKAELPKSDAPFSSPVVRGDRVFITLSKDAAPRSHHVLCFAKADGKPLWKTEVPEGPWKGGRNTGYPTPCVDGERVYVLFGSAVAAALDFDGKILWRHELKRYKFNVAMGSSPVLYGDTVVLLCEQNDKASSLIALDKKTGEVRWEVDRPEMVFAHSTPVLAKINGSDQFLVMVSKALQGIDPASGKVLWTCEGKGDTASPACSGNLVYADGGRGGPGVCVEVPADFKPGAAPVTLKEKWHTAPLPGDSLSSPTPVGEYVYRHLAGDRLRCYRFADGEEVYAEKIPGAATQSSAIATADGLLYFASGGTSYVVRAGPKFEVVAKNDLGDGNQASPAVSDRKLYIKGQKYLWCIGNK